MQSLREDVFNYVKSRYGSDIEYPWRRFPDYAVFRHKDNRKLYGIIGGISRKKLGLKGDDSVDVINLKTDGPQLADMLRQREGFFAAYHMTGRQWISIMLDGTVPIEEIFDFIDISYEETASSSVKKAVRPPKEWIIPSNPKYYDSVHAFDRTDEINWKQGRGIRKGDTVYMYIGAPVSAVLYKCVVIETDIPYHFQRKELAITSLMRIRLQRRYDPDLFPFERLKQEFDIFAVRGPRGIPDFLSRALNS